MSVSEQITRLETAKADIASAINAQGVDVPEGTTLDGMASLISEIGDSNVIPIERGGTGATDAATARTNLGAAPKSVSVTTAGTDLDDYKEEGWYFFQSSSYTPTNIPSGSNGWLNVITSNTNYVKQIWYRLGTPGSNDFLTYVRTYASTTGWGAWSRLLTNVLLSTEYGTTLPTAGTKGRIFFKKVDS